MADLVSHPPPRHLRTALIASKPTSISAFVASYQITNSVRKRNSGLIPVAPQNLIRAKKYHATGCGFSKPDQPRFCGGLRSAATDSRIRADSARFSHGSETSRTRRGARRVQNRAPRLVRLEPTKGAHPYQVLKRESPVLVGCTRKQGDNAGPLWIAPEGSSGWEPSVA